MSLPEHLYHAAPLHYVPAILASGALLPVADLIAHGILPRATAARRDRKLGLQAYAHLSPKSRTPLLADKLRKGYPHALFVFDGPGALALPGAAVVPYNPKSWRHREDFAPVSDPMERAALLFAHASGRYPSLEIVAPGPVPLSLALRLAFVNSEECLAVRDVIAAVGIESAVSMAVDPDLFPRPDEPYRPSTLDETETYFAACRAARRLLPAPKIAFD
jgi:hypothetical protein